MHDVPITSEFIELAALLKHAGIVQTGGHAKFLIQEGCVRVDGQTATQRRAKIRPGAVVEVEVEAEEVHRLTVTRG